MTTTFTCMSDLSSRALFQYDGSLPAAALPRAMAWHKSCGHLDRRADATKERNKVNCTGVCSALRYMSASFTAARYGSLNIVRFCVLCMIDLEHSVVGWCDAQLR